MSQNPYAGKPKQVEFLKHAEKAGFGPGSVVTYADIDSIVDPVGLTKPWWLINAIEHRFGRGQFKLPAIDGETPGGSGGPSTPTERKSADKATVKASAAAKRAEIKKTRKIETVEAAPAAVAKVSSGLTGAIPAKDPHFVQFGHFKDIKDILKSEMFYNIFVTGLSGNGKTFMVEQACAKAGREMFRCNITIETDEDDLLGGFRLIDGETRWFDGPVVEAMRRGAVLLLDEVDLASNKIMCLQPVLEGKPILLKKINEIVAPAPGFTVVATANTKGKGSDDGRFIGTNVLNEAFLERFAVCMEQEYPAASVETRIINDSLKRLGVPDEDFATKLVNWADHTRKLFYEGGCDEIIATRRLEHIVKAFSIFGDRTKAITLSLNRFDDETKASFLSFWKMIDAPVEEKKEEFTGTSVPGHETIADQLDEANRTADMSPF